MERARSLLADAGHQLIDNGKRYRRPGVEEGVDFRASHRTSPARI
jgi:hypothetical protein